ncbi:hypothetical protein Btru_039543 [Bulinus truncatus]|nr:hypothetical protein Btru_039543 [Bulinus truncatus]
MSKVDSKTYKMDNQLYGDHETQVSEGGEADLHKYFTGCEKNPDTASHVWWEFDVYTATHVVFDDIEASHTSLRLFYDREDSTVVSVNQVSVDCVDIESDWCALTCVTCDKSLGDKLNTLWRHYIDVWRKVFNKYFESRDVDKLNFIVSHPHGCSKQVSVGHWLDRYKVGGRFNKFTYTTCTCPGSSGARVDCVGYEDGDGVGVWWNHLVHSGSLNFKLNYSGTGRFW